MPARLPLGAIVAVVDLLDCRTTDQLLAEGIGPIAKLYGDYGPGRYGWVLGNVRTLSEPIGCHGRQGFWTLPDGVGDEVMTDPPPFQIHGEQRSEERRLGNERVSTCTYRWSREQS